MKRTIYLYFLIILLTSCGGTDDISTKMQGNYVATDSHKNPIFYGLTVKPNRVFSLWYLSNSGTIEEKEYKLNNLEVKNFYKINYNNEEYPTWVYKFTNNKYDLHIVFWEYYTGKIEPHLIMGEDFTNSRDLNNIDKFQESTILIPFNKTMKQPKLKLLTKNTFLQSPMNNYIYYTITGDVIESYYKRVNSYFPAAEQIFQEHIVIEVEEDLKVDLYISNKTGKAEPVVYTYTIGDKVTLIGAPKGYSFEDSKKQKIVLFAGAYGQNR